MNWVLNDPPILTWGKRETGSGTQEQQRNSRTTTGTGADGAGGRGPRGRGAGTKKRQDEMDCDERNEQSKQSARMGKSARKVQIWAAKVKIGGSITQMFDVNPHIRHHFIREAVQKGEVELVYIPTNEQLADINTKGLTPVVFRRLRDRLLIETE